MILTFNIRVYLNPMSSHFISWCQELAQADPLALNFEFFKIKFAETQPFNDSFNQNGNESSTFALLMGGFLTLYFLTPIIILVQTGLLKLVLKYSRFWIVRKIGKII